MYYPVYRAELEDYAKRFADFQASLTETNARFNTYKETMATLNKVHYTLGYHCMHGSIDSWYCSQLYGTLWHFTAAFDTLLRLRHQLYEDYSTCTHTCTHPVLLL
jgi:hypothetical protein